MTILRLASVACKRSAVNWLAADLRLSLSHSPIKTVYTKVQDNNIIIIIVSDVTLVKSLSRPCVHNYIGDALKIIFLFV